MLSWLKNNWKWLLGAVGTLGLSLLFKKAKDSKIFREYYNSNSPRLDYNYEFEGEDGGTFKAMFQLGANLFWF